MRLKVETLQHCLDVFLWENPEWAKADIVVENTNGGRVFARKPLPAKGKNPFDIEWEERDIYADKDYRRSYDTE